MSVVNTHKNILIVDDETVNLDFFDLMLSRLGYVVERAEDGVEALERLRRFSPDLILLDNVMPRMSGWELTKLLKADPAYRGIPIVMFSALDDVKDKIAGYELGVDDYITKPFNFSEVLARIKAVLRNRELFGQVVAREARLEMAEELNTEIKGALLGFMRGIDDCDAALQSDPRLAENARAARRRLAELVARIEDTLSEWADLKEREIDLAALESRIRQTDPET